MTSLLPACCFLSCILACVWAQPYVAFDIAKASSTYSSGNLAGSPDFAAERALDSGSGYWCSAGSHAADQVVSWTGTLDARRKAIGLKISWAYGPGEVKVLTSPDGGNFEEARCWQASSRDGVSYEESVMFDSIRDVKAVTVAMRGPKEWQYFGINEVALISAQPEPFMLISGITSEAQEQCLAAQGSSLALQPCNAAIAAGDGQEIFQFNGEGQLQQMDGQCVILAGGATSGGGSVGLGDCEQALRAGDGRSLWEVSPNAQMKMSAAGNYCLSQSGMGEGLLVQDCGEASGSIDARDKWFLSAVSDFDPAARAALGGYPLLKAAADALGGVTADLQAASAGCAKSAVQVGKTTVLLETLAKATLIPDALAMIPAAAHTDMGSVQQVVDEARRAIAVAHASL